jgi:hypothetical protein
MTLIGTISGQAAIVLALLILAAVIGQTFPRGRP